MENAVLIIPPPGTPVAEPGNRLAGRGVQQVLDAVQRHLAPEEFPGFRVQIVTVCAVSDPVGFFHHTLVLFIVGPGFPGLVGKVGMGGCSLCNLSVGPVGGEDVVKVFGVRQAENLCVGRPAQHPVDDGYRLRPGDSVLRMEAVLITVDPAVLSSRYNVGDSPGGGGDVGKNQFPILYGVETHRHFDEFRTGDLLIRTEGAVFITPDDAQSGHGSHWIRIPF